MLSLAVIGVGNAGGNVAKLAWEREKIPSVALNTSSNDLSMLAGKIPTVSFGTGRGSGKNREESKELLKNDIADIVKKTEITSLVEGKDLIFVVSSCGGGTGSGASLILSMILAMTYQDALVIPVGIAPLLDEGYGSQINFLDYYSELKMKAAQLSYMLYDNNNCSEFGYSELLETVNNRIVDDMLVLAGTYNYVTSLDSIDERDMQTILAPAGRIVVARAIDIKERDTKSTPVEKMLLDDLYSSPHAEIQNDGKIVSSGLILNISKKLEINPMIPSIQRSIGSPLDAFQHIAYNESGEQANNVFLILSGLSLPKDRKDRSVEKAKEISAKQTAPDPEDSIDMELGELKKLKDIRVKAKPKTSSAESTSASKEVDIDSIMHVFGL